MVCAAGRAAADLGAARAAGLRAALLLQARRCELCVFPAVPLDGLVPAVHAPRIEALARAIIAA